MGTLKDRLRTKYIQNGDKGDVNWTLNDLIDEPAELDGRRTKASDFELEIDPGAEAATIIWRPNHPELKDPHWLVMRIESIKTGAASINERSP